ncbi:hypothetical protein B0H63DRAFT_109371 [Podospora didyma]|uniref:Secreted protein n=1 Tax=Podospora didyma TaxID=330526 RepID=A0AAE0U424_9PEZI|nr:hypothetical protein B0H63DRAFT_109371 [Podospora didyma]
MAPQCPSKIALARAWAGGLAGWLACNPAQPSPAQPSQESPLPARCSTRSNVTDDVQRKMHVGFPVPLAMRSCFVVVLGGERKGNGRYHFVLPCTQVLCIIFILLTSGSG